MSARWAYPRLAAWVLTTALTVGACGTSVAVPTPVGDAPVSEQVLRRLLTIDDLKASGADTSGLEVRVEDFRALGEAVDADQVRGISSWYGLRFERGDGGDGLTFSVIEYDSAEAAHDRLQQVETGPAFIAMTPPVGEGSAMAAAREAGTGPALVFVKARRFIALHTIVGSATGALVDATQVEALARLVDDRL